MSIVKMLWFSASRVEERKKKKRVEERELELLNTQTTSAGSYNMCVKTLVIRERNGAM